MLIPMERTPAPARSASALTAQKQNVPPMTHHKPQKKPTGLKLNVPVTKATTSALISTPQVIIERNAQLENFGHFLRGVM